MSSAFDLWGRWIRPAEPEPQRMTVTGTCYAVDWQRRRLTPVGDGLITHCLHGERLNLWCSECEADLDALALHLLP